MMKSSALTHRAFFFVVIWFTTWVGFFGFFRPEQILRALPWPVPPLHARFVGSLYLSATVFLLLAMLARTRLQMRTIVDIALAWTGWLLIVTFVHWEAFDFGRRQTWFWLVAYIAFPLVAGWLAWQRAPATSIVAAVAPRWVTRYWVTLGIVLVALAILLFFAPNWVATIWPWKITTFLSQIYSGPVLGYGVACVLLARRGNWIEALIPMIGMLVFAVLALVGSSWHLPLFTQGSPSQIIWFGGLAALAVMSTVLVAMALRAGALTARVEEA